MRRSIIASLLLSAVLLSWKSPQPRHNKPGAADSTKVDYKLIGAPMPPLRLYSKEGKYLTEKDFSTANNLILMLFNPTCEHCEEQARRFKDSLDRLPDTKLVLVAGAMMKDYLDYFLVTTRLRGVEYMPITIDSSEVIDKTFKYVTLPQLNIYNKERKLVKMFYGVTPMDSLRKYLN